MKYPLALFFIALAPCLPASLSAKTTTLIHDNFAESGDINGTAPANSTIAGAVWKSGVKERAVVSDGKSAIVNIAKEQSGGIDLGPNFFRDNPGIYILSMNILFPEKEEGKRWMALGFNNGSFPTQSFTDITERAAGNAAGSPWVLLRAGGQVNVFAGPGNAKLLAGTPAEYASGKAHTLKLALDTRGEKWKLKASVNGTPIPLMRNGEETYEFNQNPEIRCVGFSATSLDEAPPTTVAISDFRLEKSDSE
ncbi:MAG: hypothetical protein WC765_00640 [Phycisphaerae bacterium]|jgi:hypothetical protein